MSASRVKTVAYSMIFVPFGLFVLWGGLTGGFASLSLGGRLVAALVAAAGVLSAVYALWRCLFPPTLIVDQAGIRIEGGMWWTDRPLPWSDVKSVEVWTVSVQVPTEVVFISRSSSRYRLPLKCWKLSSPELKRRIDEYRQRAATGWLHASGTVTSALPLPPLIPKSLTRREPRAPGPCLPSVRRSGFQTLQTVQTV